MCAIAAVEDEESRAYIAELALEYLLGLRVLLRHQQNLGVLLRLDTTEAKTQALHDVVYFSKSLRQLGALFLFLDELEKQDGVQSKTVVVRYLSAIRALIDALPENLFLILAMTPDARLRYGRMLPALAGRLRHTVSLQPLQEFGEAQSLYDFYVEDARRVAQTDPSVKVWAQGNDALMSGARLREVFEELLKAATASNIEGVLQRSFLDTLHMETAITIANATGG